MESANTPQKKRVGQPNQYSKCPDTVTVNFNTRLTGILDMQDPRAVVWVKLINLQQRYNKPVYVEIDPETQAITQLLIPKASRAMSIESQGEGNVNVMRNTSPAKHYLRRTHPDIQPMLAPCCRPRTIE